MPLDGVARGSSRMHAPTKGAMEAPPPRFCSVVVVRGESGRESWRRDEDREREGENGLRV